MGEEIEKPEKDALSDESRWSDLDLKGKLSLSELTSRQKIGIVVGVLTATLVIRHFRRSGDGEKVDMLFPGELEGETNLKDGDVANILSEVEVGPDVIGNMERTGSHFLYGLDSIVSFFLKRDRWRQRVTGRCDPSSEGVKGAVLLQLSDVLSEEERGELVKQGWEVIMKRLYELQEE